MNPFSSRINTNSWVVPVTAMSLVLGFMVAKAWVTEETRFSRLQLIRSTTQSQRVQNEGSIDLQDQVQKMSQQVETLRDQNTKLENAVANQSGSTKVLNTNLQEAKMLACLTDAVGPGITITLKDSAKPFTINDQIIHDMDVLRTVNELWASGAEAISVNKLRVASTSSWRCVGPTIIMDGVRIASPISIRAIGDPATLAGGLNLPGGVLSEIRSVDPDMVSMEKDQEITMGPYTGPTSRKYLKVPVTK